MRTALRIGVTTNLQLALLWAIAKFALPGLAPLSNFRSVSNSGFCGEAEDVEGALTPVGRGVAQVFHDLLVELLIVAKVEEGKEEEGQEESEEVKGGNQVEEITTTWMAMMMVVSGVRTKLELEPL